eukprot:Phypoly_transcript_06398.p1 GENE.Phypoly_transcript_06398~~Phypoly_transcript_06398.p1  ORF type:complete len:364 (+),score=41.79 Phypoly_transcript_06398:278-1369(+)
MDLLNLPNHVIELIFEFLVVEDFLTGLLHLNHKSVGIFAKLTKWMCGYSSAWQAKFDKPLPLLMLKSITNTYTMHEALTPGTYVTTYKGYCIKTGQFLTFRRFPLPLKQKEANSESKKQKIDGPREEDTRQFLEYATRYYNRAKIWAKVPNSVKNWGLHKKNRAHEIYVVTEFLPTPLVGESLGKQDIFSPAIVSYIVRETLSSVSVLHANFCAHGKIRGLSIYLTDENKVKLKDNTEMLIFDKVGCKTWTAAPEFLQGGTEIEYTPTCKGDIWAIGCLVAELLTGRPLPHVLTIPKNGTPAWTPETTKRLTWELENFRKSFSPEASDFVELCLNMNPQKRPSVKTLLEHPFILNHLTKLNVC